MLYSVCVYVCMYACMDGCMYTCVCINVGSVLILKQQSTKNMSRESTIMDLTFCKQLLLRICS